jgi:hypothetical protein
MLDMHIAMTPPTQALKLTRYSALFGSGDIFTPPKHTVTGQLSATLGGPERIYPWELDHEFTRRNIKLDEHVWFHD